MEHQEMRATLKHLDILFLIETWHNTDSIVSDYISNNYTVYNVCRPKIKTAKRSSGGIVALVNKSITRFVTCIKSYSEGIVWLKIQKEAYHSQYDIYVCCVYIPPKNSSRHYMNDDDMFTNILGI